MEEVKNNKIPVSRLGELIGEYDLLQLGSLLDAARLRCDDLCLDPETSEWVPLRKFLESSGSPDCSRSTDVQPGERPLAKRPNKAPWTPWLIAGFAMILAAGGLLWSMLLSFDTAGLKTNLANTQAENSALKQKYHDVLFAAREVAASDQVRGRVIVRDASHHRTLLPGIKVRLYRRPELEAHLSARYADIAEAGGTDASRLALHFLNKLPDPAGATTTNSDGLFEFKIPEPGEYVIQTSIRSAKTGAMRLWFVAFDSRDPLNTAVDITESNAVQQFNPFLMLVEGR